MKKITVTTPNGDTFAGKECDFGSYEALVAWRDSNIANNVWGSEYELIESDMSAQEEREMRIRTAAQNGERVKNCCDEVRSYIAGYNLENFTHEEINAMLVTFSSINTAIINMRITEPRNAIAAITPSGAITQELLDDLAYIYTKWGFGA